MQIVSRSGTSRASAFEEPERDALVSKNGLMQEASAQAPSPVRNGSRRQVKDPEVWGGVDSSNAEPKVGEVAQNTFRSPLPKIRGCSAGSGLGAKKGGGLKGEFALFSSLFLFPKSVLCPHQHEKCYT